MKYLLRYLKPFYKRMAWGFTIKVLGTLVELFIPYILSYIIDEIVPQRSVGKIIIGGVLMIACALAAVTMNVTANRMASKVARDTSRLVRHDLFAKTMQLSGAQVDKFTIPSLESRLTSDTYHFHSFLNSIQRIGVRAPILLFGGLVITLIIDWRLSLIMFSILPLITLSVFFISRRGIPLYTEVQKSVDNMTRVVREDAQGIRVIKALSKSDYERRRFDKANVALMQVEQKAGITMAASNPLMTLIMNLGIVAVISVGALLVDRGQTQTGKIIAFTQYFTMISQAMLGITRMFVMYTRSSASAKRIAEVLNTGEDLPVLPLTAIPRRPRPEGYIVFDKVYFSYNKKKYDLADISFSVKRGGTLGIIGATGSGKSTILRLLMRFYDVDSGRILIDGRDVRTIPQHELHSMFGVAMQSDFLYADTIEENVKFGRDISRCDMERAAEIAQAAEFINSFEDGWQHMLTQKGTNLSGGQRQRLLITRALAGNPKILLLDDSSSALDYKTDAKLRRAIAQAGGGMTTIIVAQRVSSVMNADMIIVLDEGRIIGAGRHEELLRECEVYREISNSQMGGAFID
ncbi:MAG: ABC transporter ATP-binding protein [Clostridiales bacterium]|nr:ABC transporter ATP-binding protein [Clostridiales bacterium]